LDYPTPGDAIRIFRDAFPQGCFKNALVGQIRATAVSVWVYSVDRGYELLFLDVVPKSLCDSSSFKTRLNQLYTNCHSNIQCDTVLLHSDGSIVRGVETKTFHVPTTTATTSNIIYQ
jgi:hypothetical protein